MPVQVQFSEKPAAPQPFKEPENMTTIDLNKNDGFSDDVKNVIKNEAVKKFKVYNIIKSLLMMIGIFILLGLCVTILILLIHRGYYRNINTLNESPLEETTFKILLSNRDKVSACQTSKSVEDCCYLFFKAKASKGVEKCTVQKVLNLFLQYELEANKRSKRQNYQNDYMDYENGMYSDYQQQNSYDSNVYDLQNTNSFNIPSDTNDYPQIDYPIISPTGENENFDNYYQHSSYYQTESPRYFDNHQIDQNKERDAYSNQLLTQTNVESSLNQPKRFESTKVQINSNGQRETDFFYLQPVTKSKPITEKILLLSTTAPSLCPGDNCPTVIKVSTKIDNTPNAKAETGRIKIVLNDTKIKLSSKFRTNAEDERDSFEKKSPSTTESSSQSRQVSPCFPVSAPLMPSYPASTGFHPTQIYSMMPTMGTNYQQQPLYIINPPIYSSPSIHYQNPQINKNVVQAAGAQGQYYLCQPVSTPTENVADMQGIEIRRLSEAFTLQDLVNAMPKTFKSNKAREAIECPFGTHACADNSKCIHDRQLCDNEVNCNDASDEMDCSCKSRVGELRWCDGYLDCPNGEDEEECFDCDLDEFSCDDWSRFQRGTCIPMSQRCDGIKQCEITGKDEEDCSILTDHLGQHSYHKVSSAVGFLHRNYKGKWYPICFGADAFALDVCKTEAGPTEMIPTSQLVPNNDNYPGLFIDYSPIEGTAFAESCMTNQAAFVECPPLYCGLRLTITNPFRNTEIDTSAEAFLTRMGGLRNSNKEPILGDSRVVGGKPSQPTAWPWVVSIYKNGVFHCGGVLINEMWILTAAHCVDRFWVFYYEIQAGILRRFSYSPMEQNRWAAVAIPHEDYNKKSLKNDIALMKLSKPVRFNRYVRPICLPSEATAGEDYLQGPKPNTVCITVGWGATIEHGADPDHLREVEIPILPHCKHREDKEGDEICAGLLEGGRDACQGDSGGPLMCQNVKNRSQWYLAGVVSHGEGCARPDEPGVYTKVSKYIGWINENINGKTIGRFPLQKCPGYICTGTKRCIPKKRHCDKIVDCLYGDDESDCWQPNERSFNSSAVIVGDRRKFFKNLLDILDLNESSEEDDSEEIFTTTNTTLEDGNGLLENNTTLLNTTTELITETTTTENYFSEDIFLNNFTCKNMFQIIPFHKKCDQVVNCEDGTDELDCLCVDYLQRFHKEAICDGVTDCRDMSDEANCAKCRQNEFLCRISQKCVPSVQRCDGRTDCINSEDEWDCVALTDGRTLVFDSDLRPKQSMKGIITINRFGVWRPLCTNASVDKAASIAANVCNLLGFEEYTVFHKLSVPDKPLNVTIDGFQQNHSSLEEVLLCGGLFVRCLNVSSDDNIHKLHQDSVTSQVELYTSPWNAVIYLDGKFRCTGTILNPHWIIAARTCFQERLEVDAYIAVLLGKGKAHLDVEGPHEQVILIDGVAVVENEAVLLRTEQKIYFSRYVKPARITAKSRFIKEQCVAMGFINKRSEMVVLEPKEECSVGFRCFKEVLGNCKVKNVEAQDLWNGIITCYSREGWYTAAVYSKVKGPCGFNGHRFSTIDEVKTQLAMGNDLQALNSTKCPGFRCMLGQCKKNYTLCDGISDCRNGEDEELDFCSRLESECHLSSNCTKLPACKWTDFKCRNGTCIPKSSFCDAINDCGDNYDEPEECSCRTYLEAVHPEKNCDGTVNCWDRSDEKNCSCQFPTNVTCGQTDRCISQEMLCDGFRDCPDGEDESLCYSLKTSLRSMHSGEVLRRTAGVWHSGCFTRNLTTTKLEQICEKLGFAGSSARAVKSPTGIHIMAMKPIIDGFDVVWIRKGKESGGWLQMRTGNEPYVKFMEDANCYRLFINCM